MGMAMTTITGEVSGEGRGALEGMEEELPHQCWEEMPGVEKLPGSQCFLAQSCP